VTELWRKGGKEREEESFTSALIPFWTFSALSDFVRCEREWLLLALRHCGLEIVCANEQEPLLPPLDLFLQHLQHPSPVRPRLHRPDTCVFFEGNEERTPDFVARGRDEAARGDFVVEDQEGAEGDGLQEEGVREQRPRKSRQGGAYDSDRCGHRRGLFGTILSKEERLER
jgi:hypothetical protein